MSSSVAKWVALISAKITDTTARPSKGVSPGAVISGKAEGRGTQETASAFQLSFQWKERSTPELTVSTYRYPGVCAISGAVGSRARSDQIKIKIGSYIREVVCERTDVDAEMQLKRVEQDSY